MALGGSSSSLEAMGFAVLAKQRVNKQRSYLLLHRNGRLLAARRDVGAAQNWQRLRCLDVDAVRLLSAG